MTHFRRHQKTLVLGLWVQWVQLKYTAVLFTLWEISNQKVFRARCTQVRLPVWGTPGTSLLTPGPAYEVITSLTQLFPYSVLDV
jgi:hypothetical protein